MEKLAGFWISGTTLEEEGEIMFKNHLSNLIVWHGRNVNSAQALGEIDRALQRECELVLMCDYSRKILNVLQGLSCRGVDCTLCFYDAGLNNAKEEIELILVQNGWKGLELNDFKNYIREGEATSSISI